MRNDLKAEEKSDERTLTDEKSFQITKQEKIGNQRATAQQKETKLHDVKAE